MTPSQHQVLRFIADYQNANDGVSPSMRDIAAHCGFSVGNAHNRVSKLRKLGILADDSNARSLRIINPPRGFSL
jgi:hypothetical protein